MNPKLILVCLVMLASLRSDAQRSAGKSTEMIVRLRSTITHYIDGQRLDTSNYYYSGSHGYNVRFSEWEYDSVLSYAETGAPGQKRFHTFDVSNRLATGDWYNADGSLMEHVVYSYPSADETEVEITRNSTVLRPQRIRSIWSADGVVCRVSTSENGGVWELSYIDSFFYSNGLVSEEIHYDVIRGTYKYSHVYNGNNQLTEVYTTMLDTTSANGKWDTVWRQVYKYYSDGMVKEWYESYTHNQWVPASSRFRKTFKYDTRNLLVNYSPDVYHSTKYYYDEVFPAAINETIEPGRGFTLYPVPASNNLYVRLERTPKSPIEIQVTDISGRIMKQLHVVPATDLHLSVADLPNGSYMLHLKQDRATVSNTFHILR